MAKAPCERLSRDLLTRRGYWVGKASYYCHRTRRHHDLFGCIDMLALGDGYTLAVQSTSYSNVVARVKKIKAARCDISGEPLLDRLKASGHRVVVHGWHQPGGKGTKWVCREVEL